MTDHRKNPRLYVNAPLEMASSLTLENHQAHYLTHVLRLKQGDAVSVFNGQDGEFLCHITGEKRKQTGLNVIQKLKDQPQASDIIYAFAPLKHARLDYMVQKVTEMGAGILQPVLTHRTQMSRINLDRMKANAIEAAEQCELLTLPEIRQEKTLSDFMEQLEPDRPLVFCDETAPCLDPIKALQDLKSFPAILVGPEGGFNDQERNMIRKHPAHIRISLGPRILRADTAAVAALALVQAVLEN